MIKENEYQKILIDTRIATRKGWDSTKIEWRKSALEIIYVLCVEKETFTANEFTDKIKKMEIKTHDNRAIGGLIRVAQKFDWVEKTGESEISRAGHLSRVQIWKSLIHDKNTPTPEDISFHKGSRAFIHLGNGKFVMNGALGKQYKVQILNNDNSSCECPDFMYRKGKCKHIREIEVFIKEKTREEINNSQGKLL